MANMFTGDNDHGDRIPSTDVLLQMIKQLRTERDAARRDLCVAEAELRENRPCACSPQDYANRMKWDCFKSDTLSQEVSQEIGNSKNTFERKTRLDNSYDNIVNKHHNAFEKLSQEEKTNG